MKPLAVVTFGRFQTPHRGHMHLISKVEEFARIYCADPFVLASHSEDNKRNPLSYGTKINALYSLSPRSVKTDFDCNVKNIFDSLSFIKGKYSNVIFVCGSDRMDEYEFKLNKYNGDLYSFDSITVKSAGDRQNLVCTGEMMRKFVAENDFTSFSKHCPEEMPVSTQSVIFNEVKSNLTF